MYMNAVLLIRKYFFIVLLFIITPTSAFSLDLICKYVETTMIETLDQNDKIIGIDNKRSKAKNQKDLRIEITNRDCFVNETKFKKFRSSEDTFWCSNQAGSTSESLEIDRYSGNARQTLQAKLTDFNVRIRALYKCKKGKAKKKF